MYLNVSTSHTDVETFVEVLEAGQERGPREDAEEKGQEVESRAHIIVERHCGWRGGVYSTLRTKYMYNMNMNIQYRIFYIYMYINMYVYRSYWWLVKLCKCTCSTDVLKLIK